MGTLFSGGSMAKNQINILLSLLDKLQVFELGKSFNFLIIRIESYRQMFNPTDNCFIQTHLNLTLTCLQELPEFIFKF